MSYQETLKLAGAEVLVFNNFGSYQGDWWAKVNYQGETGWIHGSFGSCSGCDAFEAEFWSENHYEDEENYKGYHDYCDLKEGCSKCDELKVKLIEFGKGYLDGGLYTQEQAEKIASEDLEWDMDAQGMVDFIESNKNVGGIQ